MPFSIEHTVQAVQESIQAAALHVGRDPASVTLVAVTKTVTSEPMREAHAAGVRIFGENRLQEAQQKQQTLSDLKAVSWHFIGQVQRRKIKDIVGAFALIHSVESIAQAREMDGCAKDLGLTQAVLLQVNVSGEETKGGYSVSEVMQALPELDTMMNLSVRGLMTIPPWAEDIESSRPYFCELRELAHTIRQRGYQRISMNDLSMGMSRDFMIAVEEGASIVRVGTALFGSRTR